MPIDDSDHPYWRREKKTVFVPVEVEYHPPTGIIYPFTLPTRDDVEKAFREHPARNVINEQIAKYEEEIAYQKMVENPDKVREAKNAIQVLEALAGRF